MSTLTEVEAFRKRERAKRKAGRNITKTVRQPLRKWNLHDTSGNAVNDDTKPVQAATAEGAALAFLSQMNLEVRPEKS